MAIDQAGKSRRKCWSAFEYFSNNKPGIAGLVYCNQ
jgi:hypothetical protein